MLLLRASLCGGGASVVRTLGANILAENNIKNINVNPPVCTLQTAAAGSVSREGTMAAAAWL